MKKITLSQLAVLGLTILSSQSFATVSVSGKFEIDKQFTQDPKPADLNAAEWHPRLRPQSDDQFTSTKAILDFTGDIEPKLTAHVRLDAHRALNLGYAFRADRAYVNWTPLETVAFELGKTEHLAVSIDNNRYTPCIDYSSSNYNHSSFYSEKSLSEDLNRKRAQTFGASVLGSVDSFNYKVSLVRDNEARDDTSVGEGLSWCYGGRASYTVVNSEKMSWALGLGFFNKPRKVPAVGDYIIYSGGTSLDSYFTGPGSTARISFKGEEGLTVDLNGTVGNFSLTAAAFSSKLKVDNIDKLDSDGSVSAISDSSIPSLSSQLHNPFNKTGKLDTVFVEASYLINGQGYSFKNGVVSGLQSSKSVLEVGSRLSQSKSRGIGIALLHPLLYDHLGLNPTFLYHSSSALLPGHGAYQKTDASGTGSDYQDGDYFNVHNYVQSIFVNYHVDKNLSFKTEFLNETYKIKQNIYLNPAYADAFNDLKFRQITVRLDYSF